VKANASSKFDKAVEWIGSIVLVGIILWWWGAMPVRLVQPTMWGVLATLPGIVGLVTHFAVVLPRFRAQRQTVEDYRRFCKGFNDWWLATGWPEKLAAAGYSATSVKQELGVKVISVADDDDALDSARPSTVAAVWSAVILTVIFEIAATVAYAGPGEWQGAHWPIDDKNVGYPGFIFAALGAFVSVMWRMINRINANALTSRFLFTASLRATIAIAVGMVAAHVDLFGLNKSVDVAATFKAALFFLIGLFTDWALNAMRTRARSVFNQANDPCDRLPLCFIDGLDDGVIDILDELGIWDVQHLATSEPGELTIRTLYPFNRIIDWIDQAILISYLRRNIADARLFGITGAIDMATLFDYTLGPPEVKKKAEAILDAFSKKVGMSRESIDLICTNLWFDYTVAQLYFFWQHLRQDIPAPTPAA